MLTEFLVIMLVGCVLLILAGWLGDEMRAGWWVHDLARPKSHQGTVRPRHPWPFEDPDATWTELPCKH
jgi:hypothetical protein